MYVPPEGGLPIFPLPRVVLLPGELLPLHVFEPRYRALVATCMAGDRLLGMATLAPGDEHGLEDAPPIHAELGVGRIVRHQPLPDGRSNILVSFVAATRVEAELETAEPFRRVLARALPEVPAASYVGATSLKLLAAQALGRVGAGDPDGRLFELDPPAFVDAVAAMHLHDPDARRTYLATRDGRDRVGLVEGALLALLALRADEAGSLGET
jgi:hypothetical protein